MKGLLVLLLCALCLAAETPAAPKQEENPIKAGIDKVTSQLPVGNEKNETQPEATQDPKLQIPAYGARADLMEALGNHYPVPREQHYSSLLKQNMISDGNNQFSRIHAEIQKNNEKPIVYDDEQVTPIIAPNNQLPPLLESMNEFENNLISNNNIETGVTKESSTLNAQAAGSPVLSTPTKYTIPTIDLSEERKALKEHQLNTEVQLHRLLHAMNMISESIYDPLRDQYEQGANEMLDAYLNDPYINRESPLYRHIAADHAFFNSPFRGEQVADALYKQAMAQEQAAAQQKPAEAAPAQQAPADKTDEEKAALRQKTLDNAQVRH